MHINKYEVQNNFTACQPSHKVVARKTVNTRLSHINRSFYWTPITWSKNSTKGEDLGASINFRKLKQLVTGGEGANVTVDSHIIKILLFRCLGVTLSKYGRSDEDITYKINEGKVIIGQLNSVLQSWKIIQKAKKLIYSAIFENIVTCGSGR